MDDRLKELMQELGNAINESLADSEQIAEAIGDIRRAGYDVFLVLEATIGFNKRPGDQEAGTEEPGEGEGTPETKENVNWTSQDEKFLRALKITIDE